MRRFFTAASLMFASILPISSSAEEDKDRIIPIGREASSLDIISRSRRNQEIKFRNTSPEKFEASLRKVGAALQVRGRAARFNPQYNRGLSSRQQSGAKQLVSGLNRALKDGTIKKISRSGSDWVLYDGSRQGLELRRPNREIRNPNLRGIPEGVTPNEVYSLDLDQAIEKEILAGSIIANDFEDSIKHAGGGKAKVKWKWKWWGFRVRFTHKAAYYLCHWTSWVLNQLPLPGWIEWIIKAVACSFHALDFDKDGLTLNITWFGAFWFSDGF